MNWLRAIGWRVKAEWIKATWHPVRDQPAEYQRLIDAAVVAARTRCQSRPKPAGEALAAGMALPDTGLQA